MPIYEHGSGYIDKVREEMQVYIRRLIGEAESLHLLVADLENDNDRLRQELRNARDEIALRENQESTLRSRIDEIHRESELYSNQYLQLEQHNANLANLYVASYQLHGTLDREAVLAAIQEIVVNLIGSEEFAIFERELGAGAMQPIAAVGVPDVAAVLHEPLVAEAILSGETRVDDGGTKHPVAAVPLTLDGDVSGAIVIRRLLSHKTALEPLDHELFDLLARHAATALYCTALRSRVAGMEQTA